MFSERIERTIYLESSRCREELYRVLEQFGEVRSIHAVQGLGDFVKSPWFIEFSTATGANKALSAAPQGTVARGLAGEPNLVDRFRAVAGPDLPPKPKNHDLKGARYSPYPNSKDKRGSARRKDERRSKATPALLGPVSPMSSRTGARLTASHERPPWKGQRDKENHPVIHEGSALPIEPPSHSPTIETSPARTPPCSSSAASPNAGPSSLVAKDSCYAGSQLEGGDIISLPNRHGEQASIRLSDLGDSPEDVIGLLRTAAYHPLEYAKWMMVSAHYRGKGNARAALTVVNAMIDAMTYAGMSSSSLKSAVLLRSSCHLDIAKQLRAAGGTETVDSQYHYEKGCDGFRDVYGTLGSLVPLVAPGPLLPRCPARHTSTPSHVDSSTSHIEGSSDTSDALPSCIGHVL